MKRLLLVSLLVVASACKPREKGEAPVFSAPVRVNDYLDAAQIDPSVVAAGDFVAIAFADLALPVPRVRLAISSNGGASFSPTKLVEDPDFTHPLGQTDPSLAITAGGRVAIAWLACARPPLLSGETACDVRGRNLGPRASAWADPLQVSGGEPLLRDRPYLVAENERVFATWTERLLEGRAQWSLAVEDGAESWLVTTARRARATPLAPTLAGGIFEALLVDRTNPDSSSWVLVRARSADGGLSFEEHERFEFPRAHVSNDWSVGAFASDGTGSAWIALPAERGYELRYRGGPTEPFVKAGPLSTEEASRAAVPRIVRSGEGRFVAVWMEEVEGSGWRVRARMLGVGRVRGPAADVSRGAFAFGKGVDTLPGRTMDVFADGARIHVAWSDPGRGTSDVWTASAPLPRR